MDSTLLREPTLILNRNWTPIRVVTARDAIGMVAVGAAKIVDPDTYEVHDLDSWNEDASTEDEEVDQRIRSMRLRLRPPEVVTLTSFSGFGRKRISFSRHNLMRRDEYTCQYCGATPPRDQLTIDHVVPKSRGGRSSWDNCVAACKRCNYVKADRTPREAGLELRSEVKPPEWGSVLPGGRYGWRDSWRPFVKKAGP